MPRLCVYNVEWFENLFQNNTNDLSNTQDDRDRINALGQVLTTIDADLVGIAEAPNTSANGAEDTVQRLQNFAADRNLRTTDALTGFISQGQQEIAILFDPNVLAVVHDPGGVAGDVRGNPPFDEVFHYDADDDRVLEVYEHYRPPLEAHVTVNATGNDFWIIVVHAKSKGIFSSVDFAHFEQESRRNRHKLYGECTWIRRRVNEWLDAGREVVVMGDINDGPGMDYYEFQFGKSAVEAIMGDLFAPDRILRNYMGRPRWGNFGWEPSTARFTDRLTEDPVNVVIDHIMASPGLALQGNEPHLIWNPFAGANHTNAIDAELRAASDHFPVSLDLA